MLQMNDFDVSLPVSAPVQMTPRRKAALIVHLMLADGGKMTLTDLPEHLQELLAIEMTAVKLVDKDTVNAVAEEFSRRDRSMDAHPRNGGRRPF